ncbi:hypothetical protein BGX38DRAFT_1275891 [Terfezia claveryi]|nr:hypothetical protein BGX38DRAFT_1275891 [Terfezia claveryi]
MPYREKRKNNPGKMDQVHPPHKTRLPVTGHPQPPHLQLAIATTPVPVQPPAPTPAPPLQIIQVHPDRAARIMKATVANYDDCNSDIDNIESDHNEITEPASNTDDEESTESYESDTESIAGDTNNENPIPVSYSNDGLMLYREVWNAMAELRAAMGRQGRDIDEFDFIIRMFGRQYQRIHNVNASVPDSLEMVDKGASRHWEVLISSHIQALPPPLPPTPVTDTSTQTTPLTPAQKPMTNSVSTNIDHPVPTYAEAATGSVKKQSVKSREKTAPPRSPRKHSRRPGAKPGQMRRWIEEDNKLTGAQIVGIRWLTQEYRRAGKLASSLVIYMKEKINLDQGLRMGRRFFRTTVYDWSR